MTSLHGTKGRHGAQRLSASRSFAGHKDEDPGIPPEVLNAFRHHGVLRRTNREKGTTYPWCSTPFGITEFCGAFPGLAFIAGRVLNAFRHHGVLRVAAHPLVADREIVLNAFRHHGVLRTSCVRRIRYRPCAQRLSASRSFAALDRPAPRLLG